MHAVCTWFCLVVVRLRPILAIFSKLLHLQRDNNEIAFVPVIYNIGTWMILRKYIQFAVQPINELCSRSCPDSKIHGANMGPIWGRQDPGGPHVGPMNFTLWVSVRNPLVSFSFIMISPSGEQPERLLFAHMLQLRTSGFIIICHKYWYYTKHEGVITILTLWNPYEYITDILQYHNSGLWNTDWNISSFMFKNV